MVHNKYDFTADDKPAGDEDLKIEDDEFVELTGSEKLFILLVIVFSFIGLMAFVGLLYAIIVL